MKKSKKSTADRDTMRAEYDFSGGVRGKYAGRFPQVVKAVLLDPDVAAAYPDSKAVNRALRAVIKAAPRRVAAKSRRRTA
jgi:hypothetical protein